MTKREIAELMTVMQANYPDSFKGQSDAVVGAKITLWHDFFKDYPKELVHAAAKAFMANDTKGFMPNIGQINDCIQKLSSRNDMTEGEAWSYVAKAIRNSAYNSAEEFAALPGRIQRLVGSPNQLKEWAVMDAETVQSVVASNFQRTFRARQKSDAEYERLPGDVKQFMQRISGEVFKPMPEAPKYALEGASPEERREWDLLDE
jgi:hypothetical protein